MKKIGIFIILCVMLLGNGCTIISYNRAFPKPAWYWSRDARIQREEQYIKPQSMIMPPRFEQTKFIGTPIYTSYAIY